VTLDPRQRIELSTEEQKHESALAWNQNVSLSRRAGDASQAPPALRAHEARSEETPSSSATRQESAGERQLHPDSAQPPAQPELSTQSRKNSPRVRR